MTDGEQFAVDRDKVRRIVRRLFVPAHLQEDAVSEGLIGLLEARQKGVDPRTVISRRVIDFLRRETNYRASVQPKMVPFKDNRHVASDIGANFIVHSPHPHPIKPIKQRRRTDCGMAPTNRELEILRLLAAGLTQKEIAGKLNISSRTVEVHRNKLGRKLGATGRGSVMTLINTARERGFIGQPRKVAISLAVSELDARLKRVESRLVWIEKRLPKKEEAGDGPIGE